MSLKPLNDSPSEINVRLYQCLKRSWCVDHVICVEPNLRREIDVRDRINVGTDDISFINGTPDDGSEVIESSGGC